MMEHLRTLVAVLAVVLAGMVSSPVAAQPPEEPEVEEFDFSEAEDEVPPDTRAGRQLVWVLSVLNGGDFGEPKERFSDRFLEIIPAQQVRDDMKDVRETAFISKRVRAVQINVPEDSEDSLDAILHAEGTRRVLSVFLAVDEKTGRISGLSFRPLGGFGGQEGDWDSWEGGAAGLIGGLSFGAYELVPKKPDEPKGELKLVPVHQMDDDKPMAIGSAFKVFVLGAVAEMVREGKAAWSDALQIDPAKKSLPSGTMQNEPDGAPFPLTTYLDKMISISDNTAADHLLHFVGREKAEEYMARFVDDMTYNRPFLSTLEVFKIKIGDDATLAEDFAQANSEDRRLMLAPGGDVDRARPDLLKVRGWMQKPVAVDTIEWFASARELSALWAEIRRIEQLPGMEPVGRAVRINPGLPLDRAVWKSIAFKGGSEPGVMCLSFLLERDDGRWFVVAGAWNKRHEPLREAQLIDLMQRGIAIVAKHDRKPAPDQPPAGKEAPAAPAQPAPQPDPNKDDPRGF